MSDFPSTVALTPRHRLRAVLALLRPKQWIKNGFVLAPLLFSGEFLDPTAVTRALLAAALFCLGASAVYIVNDWRDIDRDRRHPTKRHRRPLASGAIGKPAALALLVVLYAALFAGAWVLPGVIATIAVYLVVNFAYSFGLKNVPVVDIFVIASGFVLRVYAGALALALPVSEWMFVTTLCLALYLAAVKRRQELQRAGTWRHIWRVVGQYANVSIFDVDSNAELHDILMSLPLYPFMTMSVTALCRHPSSLHDDDR